MRGADSRDKSPAWRLLPEAALLATAAATLLAAFAPWAWPAELASHFRVQYLVAAALLAAVFALLRRPRTTMVAVIVALPNLWFTGPYLLPYLDRTPGPAPAATDVRIASVNLLYRNFRYDELRSYLAATSPDVLVLSELTPRLAAELRPALEDYPYWLALPRESAWGLGVWSRHPLEDPQWTSLGFAGSVNLVTTLRLPGGDVRLAAVHLSSPTSPGRQAMRDAQLDSLARVLDGNGSRGLPRLVLGDLNTTAFAPSFREFLADTGLVDARRAFGLLGTWPVRWPFAQIQIDHCLRDGPLVVTRCTRGPAVGSDHYPLEISLRRRG